jgi:four helix bundle protein
MSNIAEGFERSGRKEFGQFLAVAKGSTGEILSQLYVARDQGFIGESDFERLAEECRRTGRTTGGLIRYVRSTPVQGSRFKPVRN